VRRIVEMWRARSRAWSTIVKAKTSDEVFFDTRNATWSDARGVSYELAQPTYSWLPWERTWLVMRRSEQRTHPLVVFVAPLTGRVEAMFVWTYAVRALIARWRRRRWFPRARVVKALP
jgi:hypothetical protein